MGGLTALGLTMLMPLCPAAAQEHAATTGTAAAPAYNVHVVITEEFLNRLVARQRVEPGLVQEQMDEVWIQGQRCTLTDLRFDLLPGAACAFGQFVLEGDVFSRTVGMTDQALIHTAGFQRFRATKDVFFDGERFATRHARIAVHAENHHLGVQTPLDGTLFAGVANHVAAKRAEQRRPRSEAFARQQLTNRVYPSFDATVDERLASANRFLDVHVRDRLQRYGLLPASQRTRTTDRHLHYAAAFAVESGSMEVEPPRASLVEAHAVNVYVHETAFDSLLSRLPLKGWQTTNHQLRAFWRELGLSLPPADAVQWLETRVELDRKRPLRVDLQEDRLTLHVQAILRPAGQNLLPPVEIALPLRMTPQDDVWELTVGEVQVHPQSPEDSLSDVSVRLIRDAVLGGIPRLRVPRMLPDEFWPASSPKPQCTALRAADHWLVISFD